MGRKVKKVKKKKKILSIPCLLAMAVPSFVLALVENEMLTVKNEETWEGCFLYHWTYCHCLFDFAVWSAWYLDWTA